MVHVNFLQNWTHNQKLRNTGEIWDIPDSKFHGANMGPIWGRQDPGGPHVGPMNFAIWDPLWVQNII